MSRANRSRNRFIGQKRQRTALQPRPRPDVARALVHPVRPAPAQAAPVQPVPALLALPPFTWPLLPSKEKRKALLTVDVREWAFAQNMTDLQIALEGSGLEFETWVIDDYQRGRAPAPQFDDFDVVYELYPRWGIRDILPLQRTLGALRASSLSFHRQHNEARFTPDDIARVNTYAGFQVVTQAAYDALRPHCPGVVYLTNPVNMDRFSGRLGVEGVIASWSGNAKHAGTDLKGFQSIVQPACTLAEVPLQFAEYNMSEGPGRRRNPDEMPAFYQQANVTLCASLSEGASNSVMEAMAAGHAIIATNVGNHAELRASQIREIGETGILLVDRSVGAFTEALRALKRDPQRVAAMGELNHLEIRERWSWSVWASRYERFLCRWARATL